MGMPTNVRPRRQARENRINDWLSPLDAQAEMDRQQGTDVAPSWTSGSKSGGALASTVGAVTGGTSGGGGASTGGGAHGVLVTAVDPRPFGQAIGFARRGGTIVLVGLPPGDFPAPIFDIVLKGLTIRGSIVGTRQDMAEALDFYARGLVKPTVAAAKLDDINEVFDRMQRGKIDGRVVIDYR